MTTTSDSAALGFVNIPIRIPSAPGTEDLDTHAIETIRYDQFVLALFKPMSRERMVMHATIGVCGEAGELADAIKKEWVYGKEPDRALLIEELGDLRFYIQAVQNLYGISEVEILQENAFKLAKRYVGLKYSDKSAIERADKTGAEHGQTTGDS